MPSPEANGPWGGYNSLEGQVDALRRARFRVADTFEVTGRGPVIRGTIAEGEIKTGMVLLAQLEKWPNILVSIPIQGVEAVHGGTSQDPTALVVGDVRQATGGYSILLAPGMMLDVLQRAPAA
jgi:hypothetical protein